MVERMLCNGFDSSLDKDKEGDLVAYSDYERLNAELAECKAERDFNIKRVEDITHDAEVELKEVYAERDALRARCERLEGALKRYMSKFGNCGEVYDEAKQALEVPRG